MHEERLAELRRWAVALAARDDAALASAGRTLLWLVAAIEDRDAPPPPRDRLERIRLWARRAAAQSDHELRAAGRGVLLLLAEVDARATREQRATAARKHPRRRISLARPSRRVRVALGGVLLAVTATAAVISAARGVLSPGRAPASSVPTGSVGSSIPKPRSRALRAANELGQVPVLMHHEIRPDRVGPFDQTPAEFRSELVRLWRGGYWPITAADLVDRNLGRVPAGKTPVVLTFDDATKYQLFFHDGKVVPTTAVGIMLDVARTHPGFKPTGTFYVLREPFAGVPQGNAMLGWLVRHGFELGNHTKDHLPLRALDATSVQRELALGQKILTDAVPGYRVRTMALPLGSMPRETRLARRGRWRDLTYSADGVFLVGANPAPSPWSKQFDPNNIPRIRSSHVPWNGERDFAAAYWLHELDQHPQMRYVSDGDPARITFPRGAAGQLAPRFRAHARPY